VSDHHCHAVGCDVAVPPALLMCKHHWYMVPQFLRHRVWKHYVPGQEQRKDPTGAYISAATAAILAVFAREFGRRAETLAEARALWNECPGLGRGGRGPRCCDRAGQYHGDHSGPTSFTCPKHCGCHH
jgi:hypothetical protein